MLRSKVNKIVHDPLGVIKRRVTRIEEYLKYGSSSDYRARAYWGYRHGKYGFNLRGVGDESRSHVENDRLLREGTSVFVKVCQDAGVDFAAARTLDIGCGTGHFGEVLRGIGTNHYCGVDIVDTLFAGLRKRLPGFSFAKIDVSTEPLDGTYELIIAMDVLQHIISETKFVFALENIKSHLARQGTVIISTHLGPFRRESFYFVRRPLEVFQRHFSGFDLSEPIRYADSFVFSLRRKT
jgi:2-polyprenyl-3-methyl-5-hydroxy-6-metoxy-1,4-benzoquinol methylase